MAKQDTIAYPIQDALYLNITNRCPNRCLFCIRDTAHGVGYDLWLEKEPSAAEVIAAVPDPARYREIVFCGYGEPLLRPEVVIAVSRYLKESGVPVRLNTNGLADLFLQRDILPELKGLIDVISISLNAHEAQSYAQITRTPFGEKAFGAVLDFAARSKIYIPKVILSVVRYPGIDPEQAARLAATAGVEFRIREIQGN